MSLFQEECLKSKINYVNNNHSFWNDEGWLLWSLRQFDHFTCSAWTTAQWFDCAVTHLLSLTICPACVHLHLHLPVNACTCISYTTAHMHALFVEKQFYIFKIPGLIYIYHWPQSSRWFLIPSSGIGSLKHLNANYAVYLVLTCFLADPISSGRLLVKVWMYPGKIEDVLRSVRPHLATCVLVCTVGLSWRVWGRTYPLKFSSDPPSLHLALCSLSTPLLYSLDDYPQQLNWIWLDQLCYC